MKRYELRFACLAVVFGLVTYIGNAQGADSQDLRDISL